MLFPLYHYLGLISPHTYSVYVGYRSYGYVYISNSYLQCRPFLDSAGRRLPVSVKVIVVVRRGVRVGGHISIVYVGISLHTSTAVHVQGRSSRWPLQLADHNQDSYSTWNEETSSHQSVRPVYIYSFFTTLLFIYCLSRHDLTPDNQPRAYVTVCILQISSP